MKKQLRNYLSNIQLKAKLAQSSAAVGLMAASQLAMAAGGGLDAGTTEVSEIKVWVYGVLGVLAFIYLMYYVIMAMLEKKSWHDVLIALLQTAAAGGVLAAGDWAWGIWGS